MSLAAAVTDMRVEYLDAVNGTSQSVNVPNPDLPVNEENEVLVNGQRGCWRSHLNALEK
jgi:hypothetical protein